MPASIDTRTVFVRTALLRDSEWDTLYSSLFRASQRDLCRGSRPYPRVLGADCETSTRATVTSPRFHHHTVETCASGTRPLWRVGEATQRYDAPLSRSRRGAESTGWAGLPWPRSAGSILGRGSRRPAWSRSPQRKAHALTRRWIGDESGCTRRPIACATLLCGDDMPPHSTSQRGVWWHNSGHPTPAITWTIGAPTRRSATAPNVAASWTRAFPPSCAAKATTPPRGTTARCSVSIAAVSWSSIAENRPRHLHPARTSVGPTRWRAGDEPCRAHAGSTATARNGAQPRRRSGPRPVVLTARVRGE